MKTGNCLFGLQTERSEAVESRDVVQCGRRGPKQHTTVERNGEFICNSNTAVKNLCIIKAEGSVHSKS